MHALYAWLIDRDYTDHLAGVESRGHAHPTVPPGFDQVAILGPHNIHPTAEDALRDGQGTPFTLYDDDGVLYYSGRWFENIADEFTDIACADLHDDAGDPLEDFGMPHAGAVRMDVEGKPYIS